MKEAYMEEIKITMEKACPNLMFDDINPAFNELVITPEGWKFWRHKDSDGNITNVQFCKKAGRVGLLPGRDVFECIIEWEWRACPHNQSS